MNKLSAIPLIAKKLHTYNPIDYNKTLSVLNYTTNSVAAGVIANLGKIPTALVTFVCETTVNSLKMLTNVELYRRNRVIEKRNERTPLRGLSRGVKRLSRCASKVKTVVANHKRIAFAVPVAVAVAAAIFKGPEAWSTIRDYEYKTNLRAAWHTSISFISERNNKVFKFAKDCLSKIDGWVDVVKTTVEEEIPTLTLAHPVPLAAPEYTYSNKIISGIILGSSAGLAVLGKFAKRIALHVPSKDRIIAAGTTAFATFASLSRKISFPSS